MAASVDFIIFNGWHCQMSLCIKVRKVAGKIKLNYVQRTLFIIVKIDFKGFSETIDKSGNLKFLRKFAFGSPPYSNLADSLRFS